MPAAITSPPNVELSVPKTSMVATQNVNWLNTKRKIICFSGTRTLITLILSKLVEGRYR
jgi:hypothetical protein